MKTLCGVVAVVMAVLWINWVLATVLMLIKPTDGGRVLSFLAATVIMAPIVYGGFWFIERQHRF